MKYVPPSPSSTSTGAVLEASAAHVTSTRRWIGASCPLPSSVSVGVLAFALITKRERHASACGGAASGVGPGGEGGSGCMPRRPVLGCLRPSSTTRQRRPASRAVAETPNPSPLSVPLRLSAQGERCGARGTGGCTQRTTLDLQGGRRSERLTGPPRRATHAARRGIGGAHCGRFPISPFLLEIREAYPYSAEFRHFSPCQHGAPPAI